MDDKYCFAHASFKEYFAARKILVDIQNSNTHTFNTRLLYEEIYEFLGELCWAERNDLKIFDTLLRNQATPPVARINCIPTIRKKLPKENKPPNQCLSQDQIQEFFDLFWDIHMDDSQDSLIRYICGYTAEEFFKNLDVATMADIASRQFATPCNSDNSLVKICNLHLRRRGSIEPNYEEFANFSYSSNCIGPFVETEGVMYAYLSVLRVNKELPCVVREAIRIATICASTGSSELSREAFKSVRKFVLSDDLHSSDRVSPEIRSIAAWSIGQLGFANHNSLDRERALRILGALQIDGNEFVKQVSNCVVRQSQLESSV